MDLKDITENLIDTFLEAGKVAKEISLRGVKISIKDDKSPVTDGDIAVDKMLKSQIKILTPDIVIISEETVDLSIENKNKDFWLIDPIDGTRDYINKKEEYTLNAALIIDQKPVIGIIYAPSKNRLFYSYGKNQAFEINNGEKKILNCKKVNPDKIIGLENSGKTTLEVLNIYKKHRVSETLKMSSSLKFCVLAAGEADIYAANARAYEWDIAAGHAILEHAGGIISTQSNKSFLYGKDKYKNLDLVAKRAINLEK
jgi:3'(2'), 5'-bisphosphate nucleotidase|tara:strand:+ start:3334 stop:4101 length:768 start_codon:yes stop_codon:yes gene_type:complete